MSSRNAYHLKTPSFSSVSNFPGFGSSPSSPESNLLPLSTQDSPPTSPGHHDHSHTPKFLRNASSVRWDLFARSIGAKVKHVMQGGQLPLAVVFVSCLLIFLGALTGSGYVDPELSALASTNDAQFLLESAPVTGEQGPSQRELEEIWKKMGRGQKDGEWLRKVRDKRENRRVAPEPVQMPTRNANSDDDLGENDEGPMDADEAMAQSHARIEADINTPPPRVIIEADRKPRVPDIFDFTGHDFTHDDDDNIVPDTVVDAAPAPAKNVVAKAALDEIVGGKTKEEA